jgi:copper chaperone CopZ
METAILNLSTMYGDHHVIEVRRVLFELDGVEDVNASSCFQVVEVKFDAAKLDADAIKNTLEKAGYFEDMPIPVETGEPAYVDGLGNETTIFRQTDYHQQTNHTVSFMQKVSYEGRPLWPCPGMGVIERKMEMEEG